MAKSLGCSRHTAAAGPGTRLLELLVVLEPLPDHRSLIVVVGRSFAVGSRRLAGCSRRHTRRRPANPGQHNVCMTTIITT